tara:strand:- start:729 stop:1421 length:693 start_codon:yes stop_codon:yes gene_type:complete
MLIAIIPARGGSQRVPDKNIVSFCGQPLITYSLEAARCAGIFDEIHVSTDSQKIADVVVNAGFTVPFLRDPKLADSITGLIPVLRWVLNKFEKQGRAFVDICLLYPTAPLIRAEDLQSAYNEFKNRNREYPLLSVSAFPVPVEWAMELDQNKIALPRYPEMLSIRSQDLKHCVYDTGSFMFLTATQLQHWGEEKEMKHLAYMLPRSRSVDIDNYDDLELAEALFLGNRKK